jgi:hypothetical protein
MSVNKRIFTKEVTLEHLEKNTLADAYAKVDVFVFYDELAHRVYEMYYGGMSETQIRKAIKKQIES